MSILYYTKEELEGVLDYYDKESKIFMPNCIFDDLKEAIDVDLPKRSCGHIAYAYCYVYLISYLYRYAKYGDHFYTEKELKTILQSSEKNKHMNYITKKRGVLDQLKYIKKEKEFPVFYRYDYNTPELITNVDIVNGGIVVDGVLEREFGEEMLLYLQTSLPKNHTINFPYRAFHAPTKYVDNEGNVIRELYPKEFENEGYFFNVEDTHMITIEVFIFCMSKKDLGTTGFYLYSFLKKMNDQNPKGWQCTKDNLVKFTGLKQTKLSDTLKALEEYNMISNSHEPYYLNLHKYSDLIKPSPNTYKVKEYKKFSDTKQEIKVRDIINLDEFDLDKFDDSNHDFSEYMEITDQKVDQLNS